MFPDLDERFQHVASSALHRVGLDSEVPFCIDEDAPGFHGSLDFDDRGVVRVMRECGMTDTEMRMAERKLHGFQVDRSATVRTLVDNTSVDRKLAAARTKLDKLLVTASTEAVRTCRALLDGRTYAEALITRHRIRGADADLLRGAPPEMLAAFRRDRDAIGTASRRDVESLVGLARADKADCAAAFAEVLQGGTEMLARIPRGAADKLCDRATRHADTTHPDWREGARVSQAPHSRACPLHESMRG